MNDQSTIETENALMLPEADRLPALYQNGEIDEILARIEKEALAIVPDLSTAKGRKEVASLAHKVARSKTALDNAGKGLTEEARRQLDAVNAERKKVRDRLDDLKAKVRKPLDEWEAAEEARKAAHRERMSIFATDQLDWQASSADLQQLIDQIEAIEIGLEWEEFQELAREARDEAVKKYRADLTAARAREEQERELARLREEKRQQEEKEREAAAAREREEAARREEEEARARIKRLADETIAYIREVEAGKIGGDTQPFGVLIYELEQKVVIDERLGDHQQAVAAVRDSALKSLQQQKERAAREANERAERAKAEAADRARQEAEEAERRRKAEEEAARKKREANKRHRTKVTREIEAAVAKLGDDAIPAHVAEAIMAGKIPHVQVIL